MCSAEAGVCQAWNAARKVSTDIIDQHIKRYAIWEKWAGARASGKEMGVTWGRAKFGRGWGHGVRVRNRFTELKCIRLQPLYPIVRTVG